MAVVQLAKPPSMMPGSQMSTGLGPDCSTSDPDPCPCAWESNEKCPKFVGTGIYMGDPDGIPDSWL